MVEVDAQDTEVATVLLQLSDLKLPPSAFSPAAFPPLSGTMTLGTGSFSL